MKFHVSELEITATPENPIEVAFLEHVLEIQPKPLQLAAKKTSAPAPAQYVLSSRRCEDHPACELKRYHGPRHMFRNDAGRFVDVVDIDTAPEAA